MRHDELTELHYITRIETMPSILSLGLLSHERAKSVPHISVAMAEIQDRRRLKTLPTGYRLHEYVNLYFHARNPMMYLRKDLHLDLRVVRISTDVLDIPGTVLADRNAASGYARWYRSPEGLALLDKDMIFAESWKHPDDLRAEWDHKTIKCAEVLVLNCVGPEYIGGAYVSCGEAHVKLAQLVPHLKVTNNGHLFFR